MLNIATYHNVLINSYLKYTLNFFFQTKKTFLTLPLCDSCKQRLIQGFRYNAIFHLGVNPLTSEPPRKPPVQDSTALKNCSFLNRANIALTISFHYSLESTSNLDTQ